MINLIKIYCRLILQGRSSTCVSTVSGQVVVKPSHDSCFTLIGTFTNLNVRFTMPHDADQALHCISHLTASHSPEISHVDD